MLLQCLTTKARGPCFVLSSRDKGKGKRLDAAYKEGSGPAEIQDNFPWSEALRVALRTGRVNGILCFNPTAVVRSRPKKWNSNSNSPCISGTVCHINHQYPFMAPPIRSCSHNVENSKPAQCLSLIRFSSPSVIPAASAFDRDLIRLCLLCLWLPRDNSCDTQCCL